MEKDEKYAQPNSERYQIIIYGKRTRYENSQYQVVVRPTTIIIKSLAISTMHELMFFLSETNNYFHDVYADTDS